MTVGFSLLEILITLVITAILLTIAIPGFNKLSQDTQQTILSDELMRAIHLTRYLAMTNNQATVLCGSFDQKTCADEWPENYIILMQNKMKFSFQHKNNIGTLHWRNFPAHMHFLQFLPSGLPNFQNGTFWYCLKNSKSPAWAIILSQSGRARLVYPNAEGTMYDEKNKAILCYPCHASAPLAGIQTCRAKRSVPTP